MRKKVASRPLCLTTVNNTTPPPPPNQLQSGQAKVWAEDDRNVARSFCILRLSFAASCLSMSTLRLAFLIDERQLSPSVWGLLLPWLVADFPPVQAASSARLCNAFLGAPRSRFPCWSSLGMRMPSILETWPAQRSCIWSKMDSMLGRLAFLKTSSFDT